MGVKSEKKSNHYRCCRRQHHYRYDERGNLFSGSLMCITVLVMMVVVKHHKKLYKVKILLTHVLVCAQSTYFYVQLSIYQRSMLLRSNQNHTYHKRRISWLAFLFDVVLSRFIIEQICRVQCSVNVCFLGLRMVV